MKNAPVTIPGPDDSEPCLNVSLLTNPSSGQVLPRPSVKGTMQTEVQVSRGGRHLKRQRSERTGNYS